MFWRAIRRQLASIPFVPGGRWLRGCGLGFILGFAAMLGTIASGLFVLVGLAAWYIEQSGSSERSVLSIRPADAFLAAAICGVLAAIGWIFLISLGQRSARRARQLKREQEWRERG